MPDAPSKFRYKRVLLKVSGEVLMGEQGYGIDTRLLLLLAPDIVGSGA